MKNILALTCIALIVCAVTLTPTHHAQAQTYESVAEHRAALLQQIQQLMAILEQLLAAQQQAAITNESNPTVQMITNYGTIELELFADVMPITTDNFIKLAQEDFYDETQFHRVIDGFMIQGGDPNTKTDNVLRYGTGGPGYTIPDEHVVDDKLTNVRGTLAMANSGPESGGSQFYINLVDNQNLDFDKQPLVSKHPVFGKVIRGMKVVDTIARVETGPADLPLDPVVVVDVLVKSSEK